MSAALVGIGDAIVLLLFVFLGGMEHGMTVTTGYVLSTAWPFLVTWFVVGGALGVFGPTVLNQPKQAFKTVSLAWLLAGVLGLVIRGFLEQAVPSLPFILVTLGFNYVLLTGWRVALAFVRHKWSH
ncbi:hypothetical protein J2S00_000340 [Caldalkalibacillus uzonensis]|uniref:DUF3054 domain-containing protein n=1 Tax=Caldalkalibacillus uzonensis TaxID=353224 RepID=A0ABU0CMC1_9BACI|nr:DUF3054 domain-containing protein [Caldalkalibacillus uzonensis]MDQ0337570.1 hypothetical protein [Caldalkalibacillus uzonensis]